MFQLLLDSYNIITNTKIQGQVINVKHFIHDLMIYYDMHTFNWSYL